MSASLIPRITTYDQQILVLPTNKGIEVINIVTIVRIEAISNYSKLHFDTGKTLVVAKLLRWFEQHLPPGRFIRIHRTHIVNKNSIQQYSMGRIVLVRLRDGGVIAVARRKRPHFLQAWCIRAA
jgi:two-component system, LytTR family, response regulator